MLVDNAKQVEKPVMVLGSIKWFQARKWEVIADACDKGMYMGISASLILGAMFCWVPSEQNTRLLGSSLATTGLAVLAKRVSSDRSKRAWQAYAQEEDEREERLAQNTSSTLEPVTMLRDALLGCDEDHCGEAECDEVRQEYIQKIALHAGLDLAGEPPFLLTRDRIDVINWLFEQKLLSSYSYNELIEWAENS